VKKLRRNKIAITRGSQRVPAGEYLAEHNERFAREPAEGGALLRDFTKPVWKRLPLFENGYFDAQYSLWAPGPIVRMRSGTSQRLSHFGNRRVLTIGTIKPNG